MPVEPDTLQRLYTLPPEEFVAARTALAKQLRAAKDRDTAAEVAKLRRPSVVDWALNVVARDHSETMAGAVGAGAALREAQASAVEGRGGTTVRDALRDLRDRTKEVLALVDDVLTASGRPAAPQAAALTARLAEVAASETASMQLQAGHLGSAEVDAHDPFAGLEPPEREPSERATKEPARTRRTARPERADDRSTAADRADGAAERRRRQQAIAAAKRDRNVARQELSAAQRVLDRAEAAAAKAESDLDDARSRWEAAREHADRAEADLAIAEGSSQS